MVINVSEKENFGSRLGALVVEYSEVLSTEEKAEVLAQLDESTDQAFAQAARDLGSVLRKFAVSL